MFNFLLKRTKRRVGLQVSMTERSWITWIVCVTSLVVLTLIAVAVVAVFEPALVYLVLRAMAALIPLL